MNINELFIKASKLKLRFSSTKGLLTTEDLWDLPLTSTRGQVNLDQLAINSHSGIEQQPTVSFVSAVVKQESLDELRLEILKYVIATKQEANRINVASVAKAEEKRKLLALIQRKQENSLEALSEEDLVARLNAL